MEEQNRVRCVVARLAVQLRHTNSEVANNVVLLEDAFAAMINNGAEAPVILEVPHSLRNGG